MIAATVAYTNCLWEYFENSFLEKYQFLVLFCKNPITTGSIIPSSRSLTQKMAAPIQDLLTTNKPLRVLEVGAGTGPVTQAILDQIGEKHRLDVVELDKDLCVTLCRKFRSYQNVHIYEKDILEYSAEGYDLVISSIPHNQLEPTLVSQIFNKYLALLKNGKKLVYFEYKYPKRLSRFFLSRFQELKEIQAIKNRIGEQHKETICTVWKNCPPANVRCLTKSA